MYFRVLNHATSAEHCFLIVTKNKTPKYQASDKSLGTLLAYKIDAFHFIVANYVLATNQIVAVSQQYYFMTWHYLLFELSKLLLN